MGERNRGRERDMDWLPFVHPHLGFGPTAQAWALPEN